MNVYLLRHGIAVERGSLGYADDAERPLTDEGWTKMQRIARAIEAMELEFDRILSSPYLRARQTAEVIVNRLGAQRRLDFSDNLTPEGNPNALIREVTLFRPPARNVLLVGHEPYLSGLAAFLLSGKTGLAMNFKKGGLARLSVERLTAGPCATLEWLLTPRQMAMMA